MAQLPPDGIEKIVGGEDDRVFLHLDRQNVMLENEPAGQKRKRLAIDRFRVDRNHWDAEEISDRREKPLLVDFAGVEHLGRPGPAVKILRRAARLPRAIPPASDQKIDD